MGFLSDNDILAELEKGNISCSPFLRENLSNSSIDLRLGNTIILNTPNSQSAFVEFEVSPSGRVESSSFNCNQAVIQQERYMLNPGDFILAHTLEYVGSSAANILGQISDKSTMARLGLSTFFGAGYIDPGNVLNITLEIKNNGHIPIELQHGMHICQIRFAYLNSPVSALYSGKYLGSKTAEVAK